MHGKVSNKIAYPLLFLMAFYLVVYIRSTTNESKTTFNIEGNAISMPYSIQIVCENEIIDKQKINIFAESIFTRVNNIYNNWNPDSEISRFNKMPKNTQEMFSEEFVDFIHVINTIHRQTNGYFNPAIATVFKYWKEELKQNRLPNDESLETLRHTTNLSNIKFIGSQTLYKVGEIELDLCGIIKGYAVDKIFEYILSLGYKDVMVSWSGETRSVGYSKNKKPFNIGLQGDIRIPTPHHVYAIVSDPNDSAIATSGDSEHLWPYHGENGIDYYTHTVHPHSLRLKKVTNRSVNLSVCQSTSCMISDIIATCSVLIDNEDEFNLWLKDIRMEFPDIQILRFSRIKTPQVNLSPLNSLEKYNENLIQNCAS